MRILIIILILSNSILAQDARLDTNSILIGEQINLRISNTIDKTKEWPIFNNFIIDGIEIINTGELDTINNIITQDIIITSWDSGSYYIPAIKFAENIKTEGILLNVKGIILNGDEELKDIKQPLTAPVAWGDVWPWILFLFFLFVITFLLKRYIFNKKDIQKVKQPKVIIAADVIALKQLIELEDAKEWQKGNIKEYQSKISEIIRRYTENRFKFNALEIATDEIIIELKPKINNDQLITITCLLERSDLAKFAKSKPDKDDNKESMQLAKHFISETKIISND
tara:strand:+ start:356 stop:1207 length:852 start_codon:yes stop_codon:yes gene_type:complete